MLKNFQFQEDTEASLYGDLKRIIACVKFVPCIMHRILLFKRKDSLKADFLSWQKLLATIFFQKKSVK